RQVPHTNGEIPDTGNHVGAPLTAPIRGLRWIVVHWSGGVKRRKRLCKRPRPIRAPGAGLAREPVTRRTSHEGLELVAHVYYHVIKRKLDKKQHKTARLSTTTMAR